MQSFKTYHHKLQWPTPPTTVDMSYHTATTNQNCIDVQSTTSFMHISKSVPPPFYLLSSHYHRHHDHYHFIFIVSSPSSKLKTRYVLHIRIWIWGLHLSRLSVETKFIHEIYIGIEEFCCNRFFICSMDDVIMPYILCQIPFIFYLVCTHKSLS